MSENDVQLLAIGARAPEFDLEASVGGRLSSRDLKDRFAVIVFYPKNNTPG
jgi:peroxiredoxin